MDDIDDIYKSYAQTVYRFLLSRTRNVDLSEELTQETFYQAVKSINRYDGSCKMSVWLCQIAKHSLYKYLRRLKSDKTVNIDDEYALGDTGIEDGVIENDDKNRLLKNIHALPESMRETVYLRLLGGLSFKEIGEITGHTENWARVNFYRSKERLKKDVKSYEE